MSMLQFCSFLQELPLNVKELLGLIEVKSPAPSTDTASSPQPLSPSQVQELDLTESVSPSQPDSSIEILPTEDTTTSQSLSPWPGPWLKALPCDKSTFVSRLLSSTSALIWFRTVMWSRAHIHRWLLKIDLYWTWRITLSAIEELSKSVYSTHVLGACKYIKNHESSLY